MLSSCTYKHPGWCGCHCMDTRTPMYNKENTYLSIFLQVRVEMTQHKDKNTQVQHREHLLVHPPSHPHTRLEWKWHSTKTRMSSYNTENTYLLILLHIQVGVKMVQQKDKNTQVQHRTTIHSPPHPGWCKNDTAQSHEYSGTTQRTPTSSSSSTARLVWKWHSTKPWTLRYNTENTYFFIVLHSQAGVKMTQHKAMNTQVQHREHLLVHPLPHPGWHGSDEARRQEWPGTRRRTLSAPTAKRSCKWEVCFMLFPHSSFALLHWKLEWSIYKPTLF